MGNAKGYILLLMAHNTYQCIQGNEKSYSMETCFSLIAFKLAEPGIQTWPVFEAHVTYSLCLPTASQMNIFSLFPHFEKLK